MTVDARSPEWNPTRPSTDLGGAPKTIIIRVRLLFGISATEYRVSSAGQCMQCNAIIPPTVHCGVAWPQVPRIRVALPPKKHIQLAHWARHRELVGLILVKNYRRVSREIYKYIQWYCNRSAVFEVMESIAYHSYWQTEVHTCTCPRLHGDWTHRRAVIYSRKDTWCIAMGGARTMTIIRHVVNNYVAWQLLTCYTSRQTSIWYMPVSYMVRGRHHVRPLAIIAHSGDYGWGTNDDPITLRIAR